MSASATVFEESQSGKFGKFGPIILVVVACQIFVRLSFFLISIARDKFFKNGSWLERMGTERNDTESGEWLMNKLSKYKFSFMRTNFSFLKGAVSQHQS